ncbi:MAG: hypothetical protein ABEJ89_08070 [Haloarculaceae archaeon]
MQRSFGSLSMEATLVPLCAGLLAIAASLVGLGGSVPLAAVFALGALTLLLARERFPRVGHPLGIAVDAYLRDLWAVPLLAALTVLVGLGSSPSELQALGGLLGLVGMANYFLRPIYFLLLRLATRVSRAT